MAKMSNTSAVQMSNLHRSLVDCNILDLEKLIPSQPDTVKRIAAVLYGVSYEEVTEAMRKSTKPVAFTYLYSNISTTMSPEDWAKIQKESM